MIGARAGVHTPVSACASGAEAVAVGLALIRAGQAKVVLVGGTDAGVNALALSGFAAMRALSPRNDEPLRASRPFDSARDGFVLGEGAGALVLEEAGFARARGAVGYCELAGAGISSDSHHIAQPAPNGAGLAAAIRRALRDAQIGPADVTTVSAHATSTPQGDAAEACAMDTVFGEHLCKVAVSAPKSAMGHLLGAAGAVETVITALTLQHRVVPPTLNTEDVDVHPALRVVTKSPFSLPEGPLVALNNSLGFGGHNVALALSRPSPSQT
jgi:3-oxoacyl-[acyl-carrier-protein] synthase II